MYSLSVYSILYTTRKYLPIIKEAVFKGNSSGTSPKVGFKLTGVSSDNAEKSFERGILKKKYRQEDSITLKKMVKKQKKV